jgi:hypothetical protein
MNIIVASSIKLTKAFANKRVNKKSKTLKNTWPEIRLTDWHPNESDNKFQRKLDQMDKDARKRVVLQQQKTDLHFVQAPMKASNPSACQAGILEE